MDIEGNIWGTGNNKQGELGFREPRESKVFTKINVPDITFSAISAGENSTIFLDIEGNIWDNGCYRRQSDPLDSRKIMFGVEIKGVSVLYHYVIVLDVNGNIWSSGHNVYGELGLGDQVFRSNFIKVPNSNSNSCNRA